MVRGVLRVLFLISACALGALVLPVPTVQATTVQPGPYLPPQRISITDAPPGTTELEVTAICFDSAGSRDGSDLVVRPEAGPPGVNWSALLLPWGVSTQGRADTVCPLEGGTVYVVAYPKPGPFGQAVFLYNIPTFATVPSATCSIAKASGSGKAKQRSRSKTKKKKARNVKRIAVCNWQSRAALSESTLEFLLQRRITPFRKKCKDKPPEFIDKCKHKHPATWIPFARKFVRQGASPSGPGQIRAKIRARGKQRGPYRLIARLTNWLTFEGVRVPAGFACELTRGKIRDYEGDCQIRG